MRLRSKSNRGAADMSPALGHTPLAQMHGPTTFSTPPSPASNIFPGKPSRPNQRNSEADPFRRAMSKERFLERQADVRERVARLAEAVAQPESDLIRDATIQRFEFTFEVVWKTLKLYLERQGHECGGPRPTLKKAFAENLISTPDEADHWLQMLEDRNLTSHAYDEALAKRIYEHIVRDYARLLSAMAHQIQTLEWD